MSISGEWKTLLFDLGRAKNPQIDRHYGNTGSCLDDPKIGAIVGNYEVINT